MTPIFCRLFIMMRAVVFGVIVLLLTVGVRLGAQSTPEPSRFVGSEACQACHPDFWRGFNRNPHFKSIAAKAAAPEKTGCEGCHGPGELHIQGMGDTSKIFRFPEVEPHEVISRCLTCHSKDITKTEIRRSAHSTGEISCVSCHSIHEPHGIKNLLADKQRTVCYECHGDIRARFELPFKHRVNEGAIDCTDCHNPHGSPTATWARGHSPRMVRQGLGNDIACVNCHADKRGPFVHEHPPVRVEGCTACHNPHGSTNPRLLTRPAVFTMCLECHNDVVGFGTRSAGIPSPNTAFHNIAEPRFQNCVVCHARIHGSNVDALFRR